MVQRRKALHGSELSRHCHRAGAVDPAVRERPGYLSLPIVGAYVPLKLTLNLAGTPSGPLPRALVAQPQEDQRHHERYAAPIMGDLRKRTGLRFG